MNSDDEHQQESEAPQDEVAQAQFDRLLKEKAPTAANRPNGDGPLSPDVPSLHMGTGVHGVYTEAEQLEGNGVDENGEEKVETDSDTSNGEQFDDGNGPSELLDTYQASFEDVSNEDVGIAEAHSGIDLGESRRSTLPVSATEPLAADPGSSGDGGAEAGSFDSDIGDTAPPPSETSTNDGTKAPQDAVPDDSELDQDFETPSAPIARGDSVVTEENDLLRIDVLSNDISLNGIDDLRVDNVSLASGDGSVRIEDGVVVYDPGTAYDHLDAGDQAVVTLTYQVANSDGLTDRSSVTITIKGVNDGPVDLTLTGNSIDEDASSGTLVATAVGADRDSGDVLSYQLIDDAGGRFVIDSDTGEVRVATGGSLDYESATTHDITIRMIDSGGAVYDETFTINVGDVNEGPLDLVLDGGSVDE
ncbi:MAG: Ig-like domain-containing protein, partial [Geminicoccaceae bacterium]